MLAYNPPVQVKQPVLEVLLVVKMDPREPGVDVRKKLSAELANTYINNIVIPMLQLSTTLW